MSESPKELMGLINLASLRHACECVCLSLTAGAYSRRLGQMRRRRAELGRKPIELIDFSCLRVCATVCVRGCLLSQAGPSEDALG